MQIMPGRRAFLRRRHVAERRSAGGDKFEKHQRQGDFAWGYGGDIASGNVSTPQRKADKTPAAVTAETPKLGLEITAALCASQKRGRINRRDGLLGRRRARSPIIFAGTIYLMRPLSLSDLSFWLYPSN